VNNIEESRIKLLEAGAKLVGTGELKIGAHGKPVLFLHPKDFNGTLIELEQS
jgi:methylmalonyl-CoA/ethylmalonyl-CoA epimerase